jgi:hypothetical protein
MKIDFTDSSIALALWQMCGFNSQVRFRSLNADLEVCAAFSTAALAVGATTR